MDAACFSYTASHDGPQIGGSRRQWFEYKFSYHEVAIQRPILIELIANSKLHCSIFIKPNRGEFIWFEQASFNHLSKAYLWVKSRRGGQLFPSRFTNQVQ
jgi:hypothetical protein